MEATFTPDGDLLLRVTKDDDRFAHLRLEVARQCHHANLMEDAVESFKTGVFRDQRGRRYRLERGKRVPLGEPKEQGAGGVVRATLDGEEVEVLQADATNQLAKIRNQNGEESVVRVDDLVFGEGGEFGEEEQGPGGYEFYSPNVEENVKFTQALHALGSHEQREFLDTSNDVLDQLGLHHKAENAIGDWKDGAENSVMQTITGEIDRQTLRYSASLIGEHAKQKAVLAFMNDPDGKDALYQMSIKAPIDQVRDMLSKKGIEFRTLIPSKDGTKAVVFDQGDKLLNKILTVGDTFDVSIEQTRGQGEFIGGEDRASASHEYQRAIAEYEKDRPKYEAGRGHNRGGEHAETGKFRADLNAPITKDKTTAPPPSKEKAPLYEPDPTKDTTGNGISDAARVGIPGDAVQPPPPIGLLPRLTKNERLVEARFKNAFESNEQSMLDAYEAGRNKVVGQDKHGNPKYAIGDAPNIFSTDDCKLLSDVYNPPKDSGIAPEDVNGMRSRYNTVLHQTANAIAKKAFLAYLDRLPPDQKTVLVTSGGVAAGKDYAIGKVAAVNSVAKQAGAVWNAAGEANATENQWVLDECAKRGVKPTFVFVHANPNETWENPKRGVVERAGKTGRMVDARLFADSYTIGAKNFHEFHQRNKDKAQFVILDNTGVDPKVLDEVPQEAREMDGQELYKRCVGYLQHAENVNPAVQRGGLNGLRIWPEEGKSVQESREAQDLMESFTGEIVDSLGRHVWFRDGKRVKWQHGENAKTAEGQATFDGKPVEILAHDANKNLLKVKNPEGDILIVPEAQVDLTGIGPSAPMFAFRLGHDIMSVILPDGRRENMSPGDFEKRLPELEAQHGKAYMLDKQMPKKAAGYSQIAQYRDTGPMKGPSMPQHMEQPGAKKFVLTHPTKGDVLFQIKGDKAWVTENNGMTMRGLGTEMARHLFKRFKDQGYKETEVQEASEIVHGGKADYKPDEDFDPEQLAAGIKVEMEHTDNPKMAKEIAKDHLTESPDYYRELAKMEGKLKRKESDRAKLDGVEVTIVSRDGKGSAMVALPTGEKIIVPVEKLA